METKLHAALNRIFAQNAKKTVIVAGGKVILVSSSNRNFPKLAENVSLRILHGAPVKISKLPLSGTIPTIKDKAQ